MPHTLDIVIRNAFNVIKQGGVPIYPICFHVTNYDYPTRCNCVLRINIRINSDNELKRFNPLLSVMKWQCVLTEVETQLMCLQSVPGGIYDVLEKRSFVKFTLIKTTYL
jgi:hypothetical protein